MVAFVWPRLKGSDYFIQCSVYISNEQATFKGSFLNKQPLNAKQIGIFKKNETRGFDRGNLKIT